MRNSSSWWVITPYINEPLEWIIKCINSVKTGAEYLKSNTTIHHLLVSDGVDRPEVKQLTEFHIALDPGFGDYGDSPRYLGSLFAKMMGANALSFLDSDNWFYQNHFQKVLTQQEMTGASLITTEREFYDVYGMPLDAKCLTSDGVKFSDTSCISLFDKSISLSDVWGLIPKEEHPIDDRVFWDHILQSGHARSHTFAPTVAYRARSTGFYRDLGEPLPETYVRPAENSIAEATAAFTKRTGRNPHLIWKYQIPHDKPARSKKIAFSLIKNQRLKEAHTLLTALQHRLPYDDELDVLIRTYQSALHNQRDR